MRRQVEGFPLSEREEFELRTAAAGKDVLEIGCWKGRSAILMAETARIVVTVDTFRGDAFTGRANTLPEALANIRESGLDDKIHVVVGAFERVAAFLDLGVFELVFLDGDHTGKATAAALELIGVGCRPQAIVAVHDYEPKAARYRDACLAVDQWAEETGRTLRVVDRLAVMRRG
jgi:predicted O-methyltransferase YrrM